MKKQWCWLFAIFISLASMLVNVSHAHTDSKGKEFVVAFSKNLMPQGNRYVFVSSDKAASGTLSIQGLNHVQQFSLLPGEVKKLSLPIEVEAYGPDTISTKAIRVVANEEITIYGLNQVSRSTDAFLGLPLDTLGLRYIIPSYNALDTLASELVVVSPYNNTKVSITPRSQAGSRIAGETYQIDLQSDQVYTLSSKGDLTGSIIHSNKPIAVFGAVQCANVPTNVSACDHLTEMIPPVSTWGIQFLTAPLATRINGDVFRLLASQDKTEVRVNGQIVATLKAGEYYETVLKKASEIESNYPILVSQYSAGSDFDGITSDPFMMVIPPVEQYMSQYYFTTLGGDDGFSNGFINLIVPSSSQHSVKLDGLPIDPSVFSPIGVSGMSSAQITLKQGSHSLSADQRFGVFSYGFGAFDSYGYTGGMSFEFINPTGDRFAPNVVINQLGTTLQGSAGDSEDINLNGALDTGEDLNGNAIIDRRTEDLNGNNILDNGEDVNGDGVLDTDTGIFRVSLSPESANLKLDVNGFVPGSLHVDFQVSRLDSSIPGLGKLIIMDGVGNITEKVLKLDTQTATSNVIVTSILSTQDIDLDNTSFARIPDTITQGQGNTTLQWRFTDLASAQTFDLGYDVILSNLTPNETRVVTQNLILEYTDVDGQNIRRELGQQSVTVASSEFDLTTEIDKSIYISGETVIITGNVFNLSTFPADATLKLYIRDENGVLVAVVKDVTLTQLAQGVAIPITDAFFNTDGIILGNYQVVAVLTDQLSGVPIEVVRPFTITNENGTLANIKSSLVTDKPTYGQWDTVIVDVSVENKAKYSVVDNAVGVLTLVRPGQAPEVIETVALPSLSTNLYLDYQFTIPLNRAPIGEYQLEWDIRSSQNTSLARSYASFKVEEKVSASLSTHVSVEKPKVHFGEDNKCIIDLNNRGTSAISQLPIRYQIANISDKSVLQEQKGQLNLAISATQRDVFVINTQLANGHYVCAAQAEVNGTWVTLDSATFEVTIDVEVIDRVGSVLILQDREDKLEPTDPFGPVQATLAAQKVNTIELLKNMGWQTHYVTDQCTFAEALLTNKYDVLMVVPEVKKMHRDIQQLLSYHAFLGDGVFVSQNVAHRQPVLQTLLGLEVATAQPVATGIVEHTTGKEWPFAYSDTSFTFHPNGAKDIAGYRLADPKQQWLYSDPDQCLQSPTPPALSQYGYGKGQTSYAGFDLLAQSLDNRYQPLFAQILESLYPTQFDLWVGEEKPVTLTVNTGSVSASGEIRVTLSPGLAMHQNGSFTKVGNQWVSQYAATGTEFAQLSIEVMGTKTGVETLQWSVYAGQGIHAQLVKSKTLILNLADKVDLNLLATAIDSEIAHGSATQALALSKALITQARQAVKEEKFKKAANLLDQVIANLEGESLNDANLLSQIVKYRANLLPVDLLGPCKTLDLCQCVMTCASGACAPGELGRPTIICNSNK